MAAREVIRKWQGRQELPDETAVINELRRAFYHESVGLRSDFTEGKLHFIENLIWNNALLVIIGKQV